MIAAPRRARTWAVLCALLALAWACTDVALTGPLARRLASLVLPTGAFRTPYVLAGANARIDTVRIVLKRSDSTVVLDTSIFVPAGADSLAFSYLVPVTGSPTFGALIQYKSQGVVLFQSQGVVTAQTPGSGQTAPIDLPPILVGPGSDVVSIAIAPRDTVLSFGGSVGYRFAALKAGGVVAGTFLSVLSTSDPAVPITAGGLVTAPASRRTIWVRVKIPLPVPLIDSTRVTFAPVAVSMRVQGGNAQAGTVGLALVQPIVARVLAADSLGVAGVPVTFSTSAPGAVIATPTVLSDSLGDARTVITLGPLAGAQGFSATSSLGTRAFTATANAGAPNALTLVSGNARTVVAGTPVDSVPTVRATDGFGNPVAGATVTFSVVAGGGAVAGGSAITNVAGLASPTSWTLGGTAGANSLRANLAALTPVSFTATGVAGPPVNIVKVRGDLIARVAGAVVDSTPRLRVADAGGNAVTGTAVNFSTLTGGGSVTGTTPVTDVNGFAALGSWTLGTSAGANTIRATVGALSPVTFTISGTAGAPVNLVKNGGDLRVATVATVTDTAPGALVTDANSNPVSGVAVTFAVTGGGGVIAGGSTVTDALGRARAASWTLGPVAGVNVATATSAGLPTLTFGATGTTGAPSVLSIIAGNAQSATVSTNVAIAPQVRLVDALSNPVAGVTVTFAVTAGGGSITGASAVTNGAGIATLGSWTLGAASGANALQASAPGVSPVSFSATGLAGTVASLSIVSGNNQSAIVNSSLATPVTVVARDAGSNPVAGVVVTFAITAGGGSLTGASVSTNASGQATLGSWTLGVVAGTNTVNASAPAVPQVTFTATGLAGTPAVIAFVTDSVPSAVVATAIVPAPAVLVRDLFGNPVTGASVDFTITVGGGTVTPATVATNVSGIAAVTTWTLGSAAGVQSLRASVAGVGTPKTFLATALPGSAATIAKLAGDGQSSPVGTPFPVAPRVRVTDAFGNAVPGAVVTFAPQNGTSSMSGTSAATDGTGVAQATSWTPTQSGPVSATAGTPGAATVTFTGTGTAAGLPQLVLERGAAQFLRAGATRLTVPMVVRALDAGGNPVAGVPIALSATSSGTGPISGVGGVLVTAADGRITLSNFPVGNATGAVQITFVGPAPFPSVIATATVVGLPVLMLRAGGDAQSGNAGDTLPQPLSALIVDGNANPVPLQPVSFSLSFGSTGPVSPSLSTTVYTVLTDSLGFASLRLPLPTRSGLVGVTASTAGLPSVTFTATAQPIPGVGVPVRVEVLNGTLRAKRGGLLTDTVYVRERTATGDVLPNRFLWYFVLRSDRSSAPQDSVRTDAQGIARITGFFVGDSAGTAGITIFDRLVNLGCGFLQAEALISVSGPPEDLELVSGDFQTGVVGQDAASPIRVRVVDGGGRPISGQVVAWTSTFPSPAGGSVAGRFGTATTDAFGVASITFRLGVDLGVNRMTVTVAGAPSLVITAIGVP